MKKDNIIQAILTQQINPQSHIMKEQHEILVGIMTADHIDFIQKEHTFILKNVPIGINFHWFRKEDQEFEGRLEIRKNADGTETAINHIGVEDYLTSVITSEMSATSSIELLKAHAVISRSWVLRPIINTKEVGTPAGDLAEDTETRHITWYERDAHDGFDVCADDHCQRYEGITRRDEHPQAAANVRKAIEATWGQVLMSDGAICDARFSKSCGGASELFENAWAPLHYRYLESVKCEYCNTKDQSILSQVLNNYDQETTDFWRWTVRYSAEELSAIIKERSGIDFGEIIALNPIKRGPSYRLYELEIVGSKKTMTIGKELEIRKWLSHSHLYSSAFDVERDGTDFILKGRGWGHGIGFCQIGAAVMAEKGFTYEQILAHYFPGSELKTLE